MQHSFKKSIFILLTLLALTFNVLGSATAAYAAPAALTESTQTAEAPSLLQFTSSGHILGFTSNGMYAATGSHALHVDFVNANSVQPQSASLASADGKAAALSQVTYANLWDGVTLAYNASGIYATTYTVAAGADVSNIKLKYNAPLTLNKDGSLSIAFETGALTESAPIAWQNINGKRVAVEVAYQVRGQEVSFKLGNYDSHYPLTIDPTLTWHTFLGGSGTENGLSIAVDVSGNVYVAGYSTATWGAPVQAFGGSLDAFAAKLNSAGALTWHTTTAASK